MFLRKKYIFETKSTRSIRYLINGFFLLLGTFACYTLLCLSFIVISENETKDSQSYFYKRPPDLIVVFTGDSGRIEYALNRAREYKQAQILITGVYNRNTVTSLLSTETETEKEIISSLEMADKPIFELDYLAKNTIENVVETLRFVRQHSDFHRILIISSDYHIMRIRSIVNIINDQNSKLHFNYMGKKSDYSVYRNVKILFKEFFKFLRAMVILTFWDKDIPNF